jgi:hypothetical protein
VCLCVSSATTCSGTIDEVEEVVAKARMWRWKPYGEVTLRFAQDANVSRANGLESGTDRALLGAVTVHTA